MHNYKKSVKLLQHILADTYLLMVKTQNYHWNVEGIHFNSLHEFFGAQYEELNSAIDEIAERIRMLGYKTSSTLKEIQTIGKISEPNENLTDLEMLRELEGDHHHIIHELNDCINELDKIGDQGTLDLFVVRLRAHDKMHWVVKSHLK